MLSEKKFLITLAIGQFNRQFSRNILPDDCDVKSIPVRYSADRSYEVFTLLNTDNVRLHIHMMFGGLDEVYPYVLEVDGTQGGTSALTDEVYVSSGHIDYYYLNEGIYKFNSLSFNADNTNYLLLVDGTPLLLENGEPFLLETI